MESNTEKIAVPSGQERTEQATPAAVRRQSKSGVLVVAGVCLLTLVMLLGLGESIQQRTESRTPIQAKTKAKKRRQPLVQGAESVSPPSLPREADPSEILD